GPSVFFRIRMNPRAYAGLRRLTPAYASRLFLMATVVIARVLMSPRLPWALQAGRTGGLAPRRYNSRKPEGLPRVLALERATTPCLDGNRGRTSPALLLLSTGLHSRKVQLCDNH